MHRTSHKDNLMEIYIDYPVSKVYGAKMGPIWDRQDPGGPYVNPMNISIWVV